jgi:hypothetical protein
MRVTLGITELTKAPEDAARQNKRNSLEDEVSTSLTWSQKSSERKNLSTGKGTPIKSLKVQQSTAAKQSAQNHEPASPRAEPAQKRDL